MRVIAGEFKGRKLASRKGMAVRPTTDKVKEALFSMIQGDIPDAVCLDLFAGTGALGIEALSRGASRVYFCDIDALSVAVIRQNLESCGIDGQRAVVIKSDWRGCGPQIKEKCNIVFIDSPYEMCVYYSQILETLVRQGIVGHGSALVVERDSGAGGYELPAGFVKSREKRYGSIGVDLLLFDDTGEV